MDNMSPDMYTTVTKRGLIQAMYNRELQANGTPNSVYSWGKRCFGNNQEQQKAFAILVAKFILTFCSEAENVGTMDDFCSHVVLHEYFHYKQIFSDVIRQAAESKQLVMFLTGPSGSGKSTVITELVKYAEQFCSNINQPFTKNTILVTANSALAATLIHGQTLSSSIFNRNDIATKEHFRNCVKMLIIDNICAVTSSEIKKLDKKLKFLTDNSTNMFGGIDVIFVGDLRQLPPIGRKPITNCSEFTSSVNSYIELKQRPQFNDVKLFQDICTRFYKGCPTKSDFDTLNNRVVSSVDLLPEDVTAICTSREERDNFNLNCWLRYLLTHGEHQGLVIIADVFSATTERDRYYSNTCYHNRPNGYDPVLRCYPGRRQMLTGYLDYNNYMCDGTEGFFVDVVLQSKQQFHYQIIEGMMIKCVYASQLQYMLWEVDEKIVKIYPTKFSSSNDESSSRVIQLPVTSSNAIYACKLQGCTANNLYILSWKYDHNWPYVVFSRASSLENLFFREPLSPLQNYSVPKALTTLCKFFRKNASLPDFNVITKLLTKENKPETDCSQSVLENLKDPEMFKQEPEGMQ